MNAAFDLRAEQGRPVVDASWLRHARRGVLPGEVQAELGHVSVLSTQEYLKATPELLRAASARFERSYGTVLDDHSNGENR